MLFSWLQLFAKWYIIAIKSNLKQNRRKAVTHSYKGPFRLDGSQLNEMTALRYVGLFFIYLMGRDNLDYISIAEAAKKWGITRRRVQVLCAQGRIPGLTKFGKAWAIPKNAEKPVDRRKNKVAHKVAEVDASDK